MKLEVDVTSLTDEELKEEHSGAMVGYLVEEGKDREYDYYYSKKMWNRYYECEQEMDRREKLTQSSKSNMNT